MPKSSRPTAPAAPPHAPADPPAERQPGAGGADGGRHSQTPFCDETAAADQALEAALPKPRHNGWNRQKLAAFLRELAASQSVAQAARAVGMSRQSAYALRNRLQGTPFALGWEVALEMGFTQLAHAVMDRAINGEEVQHWYHGELVATTRRYDNKLAQWCLENPWKVGRSQMAREWSAGNFDALLERIEWASLDWEAGERLPGPGPWPPEDIDEARRREDRFISADSWYGANAGGDPQPPRRGR